MAANPHDSGRPRRRLEATLVTALAHFGHAEAEAALGALIVDPDEEIRARYLPDLVRLRKARGWEYLGLLEHALGDRSLLVRTTALGLCRSIGDDRVIALVAPLLGHRRADLRTLAAACIAARRCQEPASMELVVHQLRAPVRSVERFEAALRALAYSHDLHEVGRSLLAALDDERDAVRRAAVAAFPYYESGANLLEGLAQRLDKGKPVEHQLSALWALANVGVAAGVPTLVGYLSHPDLRFREAAVEGLDRAGARHMLPTLSTMWDVLQAPTRACFSGPL